MVHFKANEIINMMN